ncbi:MAG TPA: carbohydrate porin [Vicinamibacterales bacterium]|nr:carbohydrate porin [Vicinamibacterales bacterium]
MRLAIVSLLFVSVAVSTISAQDARPDVDVPHESTPTTTFGRHEIGRLWLSGQMNIIVQTHQPFPAPYSGENSLRPTFERATSTLLTLFTGVAVTRHTDVIVDIESAGGHGISDALGLAGFTNLDVVRNPSLGVAPYLARLMIHHTVALGGGEIPVDATPLSLAHTRAPRRLELRAGKFGTADFFDQNSVGSDSHLQFLNWTVDNNGAYDYAADTRGYTWGAIVEYDDPRWTIRFGEMLMPKVANGLTLDWNIGRAHAENLEVELLTAAIRGRRGTARLLSYVNHANMGDYREAVQRFTLGNDALPTIENARQQGRIKYGFGVNAEQPLAAQLRVFGRWGWNEPHFESFAYTEVNDSLQLGVGAAGEPWRRPDDKGGIAFVTNGLSLDHQRYLALGGSGFLLGDGALSYGRERIVEGYYTAHLWRGLFAAVDLQRIANPGYNQARGPVLVASGRLHVDF